MSFFICSNCGYGSATFIGKCPECGEWNTLKRAQGIEEKPKRKSSETNELQVEKFSIKKQVKPLSRKTDIFELDRVLGGGLIDGAVILLTGEPGIGKSTLLLQSGKNLDSVLYISGEESQEQISHRAERLRVPLEAFTFSSTMQVEGIVSGVAALKDKPQLIIVDSIQMIYSRLSEAVPGSPLQLKESVLQLVRMAKDSSVPLILVGHVTKDGDIAGPKMVEHMVDTVLTFEGDPVSHFRILRAKKNRFGSTDEIGIFEMATDGLHEVSNPLAFIQDDVSGTVPGKAVAGVMEGNRPLFFEIQSLVSKTTLPMPRRVVKGIDYNKLLLILAVLRKNLQVPLDAYDIYVNVVGGVDVRNPAADLAIAMSILSSLKELPISSEVFFCAEVGLLGELRDVYGSARIVSEAKRLGMKEGYTSKPAKHIRAVVTKIFS